MQPVDTDVGPDSGPRDSRPTITVRVGEVPIEEALNALRSDLNLFVRGSELVHVVRSTVEDEEDERERVPFGVPKIHSMEESTMWVKLCQAAVWERVKMVAGKDGKKEAVMVRSEPSERFVKAVLKPKPFAGMRRLEGVSETPFPRPDGSICQTPGYDRATRYLYEPSIEFPRVFDFECTLKDAQLALAKIDDLFVDFHSFSNPAGRSAAVSALFTLVARPAVLGPVPAFVVDATTPGTGKTLLADVCAGVAHGRDAGRHHFPFSTGINADDELSKALAAIARRGAAIVNFDNVDNAVIGSDTLENCISTRDTYTFRILGKTEDMTLPWRPVVFVTANNADWTRGMNRRIIHLRLESPYERPEQRPSDTYEHPERAGRLFEYAVEHRAELVHAVLTVLRAYHLARRPNPLTVGTFEAWAGLVCSAIVWAGGEDPLDCRPSQSGEESPDATFARILVQQWASFCAASSVASISAAQVISALYPKSERDSGPPTGWEDLRGAIEFFVPARPGQAPSATDLAKVISKRLKGTAVRTQDAPAPLQRMVADGQTHGRVRWGVEDVTVRAAGKSPAQAERDPDDPESY